MMIALVLLMFLSLEAQAASEIFQKSREVTLVIGGVGDIGYLASVDVITEDLDVINGVFSDAPLAGFDWTASLLDDQVVVCGSYTDREYCHHLDLAARNWTTSSKLVDARQSADSVVHDGKLYLFGGWRPWERLSSVETYNNAINSWTSVPHWTMPEANEDFCVIQHEEYIYYIGGYFISDGRTMRRLSTATNVYETMPSMTEPRHDHACIKTTINGEDGILVTGGQYSEYLSSTEFYGFETQKWYLLSEMNAARAEHGIGVINGQVVVFGGIYGYILDSLEVYNTTQHKWLTIEGSTLSQPKYAFAYVKAPLLEV